MEFIILVLELLHHMALREIVKIPNKILTTKSEKASFDDDLKTLVEDLIETLNSPTHVKGAGLAAPQLGVLKRVCIAKKFTPDPIDSENELETDFILINPEILNKSEPKDIAWEGCLSIPDVYGQVERSKRIKVKAYDLSGKEFTLKAEGFFARVIQHEVDHLDGILFTTKAIGETLTEKELDNLYKSA